MPEPAEASLGVVMRPVRIDDRDALLAWRNDPSAYRWYLVAAPVTEEAHDAWLLGRLGRTDPTLWIAELDGEPVGSVRLDPQDDGSGSVSIVVDARFRGRGTGRVLLEWVEGQATVLGITDLRAVVHAGNTSSRALFERAGYGLQPPGGTAFVTYLRRIPAPTHP